MADMIFQIDGVKKDFKTGKKSVKALDGVSFDILRGETLSLVGESGCGKTTCGRTILGVYEPTEGIVRWNGKSLSELSRAERTEFRRSNQMIFQDPYASLDPRMTVAMTVEEGMKRHFSYRASERREKVLSLLSDVGLTPEYADRFPHELSGGQRQRVGIARALALEPEFLVCDEPVAALDASIQAQIINLLMRLQRDRGLTYLMISHDLAMVRHISNRIAVMYLGSVVEIADAETLYDHPLHPYTQALLSAMPDADPDSRWLENRIKLTGDLPDPADPPSGCRFSSRCPFADETCRKTEPILTDREPGRRVACHKIFNFRNPPVP